MTPDSPRTSQSSTTAGPVYIDRAEKPGFIKINTWVGRELPAHSTSVGKVLVAELPFAELDAILDRDGLEKSTHKTITSRSDFFANWSRSGNWVTR